ncbi:hypothetical protein [Klebsiella phage phiKp_21]|nr:hypothetical protein [Klebsiella phage phiKp_21]
MKRIKDELKCNQYNSQELYLAIFEYYKNLKNKQSKKFRKYVEESRLYNIESMKKFFALQGHGIAYKPEYYMYLHCVDEKQANEYLNIMMENKKTSKENFIKKHGMEKGTLLWNEFKNKTLNKTPTRGTMYFTGNNELDKMLSSLYRKITNKRCIEYYLHNYDISYEKALELQLNYQKENSGVFEEYYELRDLSHKPKFDHTFEVTQECIRKRQISKNKLGKCVHPDDKKEWEKYRNKVCSLTRKEIYISELENYDLYIKNPNEWHLDHIVSKIHGFLNSVPPEIIASIHNLQIIPAKENIAKNYRSNMDINDLLRIYNENRKN